MDLDDYEIPENPEELLYRAIQLDDLVCFQHLEPEIDPEVLTSLEIPPNTKIYKYLGRRPPHPPLVTGCECEDCVVDYEDDMDETPIPTTNRPNKSKRYIGEVKQARRERQLSGSKPRKLALGVSKSAIQIYKDSMDENPNRQRELYIEAVKELKSINRKRIANGLLPLDRSIINEPETFKK